MYSGNVENCNFTNNTATNGYGGAIVFGYSDNPSTVTNCNFINNTANKYGGAIYIYNNGNIVNCNFTDNNAANGSAIYFNHNSSIKTISNSTFLNNRANAEALEISKNENNITITFTGQNNLLNAIYSNGDVNFTNVTYWGANGITNTGNSTITPSRSNNEAGINITIVGIINDNIINTTKITDSDGKIVLEDVTGDYLIFAHHDADSYYTQTKTSATNMQFYVNVTSITTNNKTVNITAKSNIPNEILDGKLIFILPNSTEVNATYTANRTWWALHTFDDYGDYKINASYIGLDNVTVNNGTISIRMIVPINTKDINIFVGDVATVVVTVPEALNGQNITITVNGTSKNVTVKNGEAKANFTGFSSGEYLITADYLGDGYYSANSTNATLTVSKIPTEISIKNSTMDLVIGDSVNNGATLTPPEAGNLTYTSSNPDVAIVENGMIKALKEGSAVITVSFAGNEQYATAENKTINITVSDKPTPKQNLTINANAEPITAGENATVIVTGLENATGNITVTVNGKTYTAPIKDGESSVNIPDLIESVTAYVNYAGDNKYNNASTTVEIIVNPAPEPDKKNLTINASAEPITVGENATVIVTGLENATGNITVIINGKTYTAPIKDSQSTISIPDLTESVTAYVNYAGDKTHNPASTTVNITVNPKSDVVVVADNVTKYYGGSERFVVKVYDSELNPIANKTAYITINGITYTRLTDENGTTSIPLGLNSGQYEVVTKVDNTTVNSVVTILSTVEGSDIVKIYRNATKYYATFIDTTGKYLADGTFVKFNINGIMYERKIEGGKGQAGLNINLPQGEYIITAINPVNGEMHANNITVLANIADNEDIVKYYKNGTQYSVKLIGPDGNAVGAGEKVTFNVNGIFYTRITDENGIATLTINLPPSNYVITADYNGCRVANNITVLPVLNATDLKMKYGDGSQFKANLVDGQGKPYAGQTIQFNINGVLYNKVTDSSGQAALDINLPSGEYIITSSFNGSNIANKITISG
jgi:predicted outer membrane repeat protein